MKTIRGFFAALVLCGGMMSCSSEIRLSFTYPGSGLPSYPVVPFPEVKIAHLSDIHILDPSLGTSGKAWDLYQENDRKLLAEGPEILGEALKTLSEESPDLVVVSGDLTKDGERVSHLRVAAALGELKNRGIKVYVLPGNHDILNPHAVAYRGEGEEKVDHVTPGEFSAIYQNLGYKEALDRDPHSLSYLAEPVPGLWLLALDSARYETNVEDNDPMTAGRIRQETARWMEGILQRAQKEGKAVLVSLHHGVVEHWNGQGRLHPDYLMEDREGLGRMLAHYGVRVVLTGHYHSHDAARKTFGPGNWILDLESGSLVTYPNPYRLLTFQGQNLSWTSRQVGAIPSRLENFPSYSREYIARGLAGITQKTLQKFFVSPEDIRLITHRVVEAYLQHYQGDEKGPEGGQSSDIPGLGLMGQLVTWQMGYVLDGLGVDVEPADAEGRVDLGGK